MKAAAFSLAVLTLNVAGPRRVHQGWPTRREAIVARLKAVPSDVDAFQEVWRREDMDALADASGHGGRALDADLGLAVTSRLPVVSTASRGFGGGYGALRARLRAGKGEIDAYSARLEPGDGSAAVRRRGQMFLLAEFIRAESSTRPFVLLGDLGVAADERDASLFLDLIEGRDLCVSHGDEVCGRTVGEQRVDYAIVPYSSRPPRESARAAFTDLPSDPDEAPPPLRFGLRARLDAGFLKLRPAAEPPGRDEALGAISDTLEEEILRAPLRAEMAGLIPLQGALSSARILDDAARLDFIDELIRSARLRAVKPTPVSSDSD